jgi:hypothetical protein
MVIDNRTKASKVAARIINNAGRINKDMRVIISEHAPESTIMTGTTPGAAGWKIAECPRKANGRNDYIAFIKSTNYKTVYIRLSTIGGRSVVYVK